LISWRGGGSDVEFVLYYSSCLLLLHQIEIYGRIKKRGGGIRERIHAEILTTTFSFPFFLPSFILLFSPLSLPGSSHLTF